MKNKKRKKEFKHKKNKNEMFLLTPKENLFISQGFRILSTLFILFLLHIPLFYKIILVMLSDSLDCGIPKLFFSDWVNPNTNLYQISDKITDMVTYFILLFYFFRVKYLEKKENILLSILLFYRLIGEIIFFITQDRYYLLIFPNFFLETSLVLTGRKYFELPESYNPLLVVGIILWKLCQEYYLHIYKEYKYEKSLLS